MTSGAMPKIVGVLPLGRSTFDVPFAEANLAAMLEALGRAGTRIVGPGTLLFDADSTRKALESVVAAAPDFLLVLQVTFTDAAMTKEIAGRFDGPFGIWAIPEPRAGGRLRLNSFCGLNLASHALGRMNRPFSWLYRDPCTAGCAAEIDALLTGRRLVDRIEPEFVESANDVRADTIAASLRGMRIGRVGAPPDGFDTCLYEPDTIAIRTGVEVAEIPLIKLFETARRGDRPGEREELQNEISAFTSGLEAVDAMQLRRSLDLKFALDEIRKSERLDAFAIRCWPETFTEYGGAVCGPVSILGEKRTPCACEADVYGALTQIILQQIAGAPVFLTDLVDLDMADETGVVWHCGQAPASMRGEPAVATVHSNRKMPLLFEFALKPGRVTFARLSQACGTHQMIIAGGEMLRRPKSFTGTSGVVRFDTPTATIAERIMASGLEHHMALAYGDHRDALRGVASALRLPILEL